MSKTNLNDFLAKNPFPNPLTLGFFYREKMRAIYHITPEANYDQILEVGGGESGLSAMLFPTAQITNIDCNPDYANSACNQQERVTYICGDATRLPFENCSFDAVTMFDLLEHIPNHQQAIAEAIRVLKPGGYLLLSTPNENWRFPYYPLMQRVCPQDVDLMAEWGHVRQGYSMPELASLIPLSTCRWMTFINPLTVVCHDISFSKLARYQRLLVCWLLSPLTWMSYWLHQPHGKGTETAISWQKR